MWDSRIRCHCPSASTKTHGDRAGCASAAVETQGGERSAAALWTRITIGTSEPASCAIVSRSWFSTSGQGRSQVGGRLSRNRHPGRTVSVKGCEYLSGIEINRERNKFPLIYFHLGQLLFPLVQPISPGGRFRDNRPPYHKTEHLLTANSGMRRTRRLPFCAMRAVSP